MMVEDDTTANDAEQDLDKRRRYEAEMLAILNEMARRVHTVMANYSSTLAGKRPEMALTLDESQAIFNGAVSGIAAFCAMMDIQTNPAVENPPPVEQMLAHQLVQQFVHVFLEHRMRVEQAQRQVAEAEASPTGGAGRAH